LGGGPRLTADDVDIDSTDDAGYYGRTDAENLDEEQRFVDVPCDGAGNAYIAAREDDGWKLQVPFCTGR
jgi:hypothetical protein